MRTLFLFLILAVGIGPNALGSLSDERAVLHTVGGDIVLAFYPHIAPRTVAQMRKLMQAGVFGSTHFFRHEPGFVLQLAQSGDRLLPLTPAQSRLIEKLPLEISPTIKHRAWRLSMARANDDLNSGETSFSILLGEAPHLDGGYTIFGEVVEGFDVVHELLKVPIDLLNRPKTRLTVKSVSWYPSPQAMKSGPLNPAVAVKIISPTLKETEVRLRLILGAGLVVVICISLIAFFWKRKLGSAQLVALHLLQVLIAAFYLLFLWVPVAQTSGVMAGALFFMCVGVFKLMNRFEAAG